MVGRPKGNNADGQSRLLDACWALLLENDPGDRLTIASVCERAGVTPPTLYHHFGDLASLEAAASKRAFEQWHERLVDRVLTSGDPHDQLRQFTHGYVRWARENPDAYMILFSRPGRLGADGRGPRFEVMLQSLAKIHDMDEDDPRLIAMTFTIWSGLHGVAMLAVVAPELSEESELSTVDHLISAVNAHDPPENVGWVPELMSAREQNIPRARHRRHFRF